MRRRIALAVFVLLIIGLSLFHQIGSAPVTAQTSARRPLLLNEVEDWCVEDRCSAQYADLPDGYLRVVVNESQGELSLFLACVPMSIPSDVEGWVYAEVFDHERATPDVPTQAPGSTSDDEQDAIATARAKIPNDRTAVLSIEEVRAQPDVPICELVVRRAE